jgi:hypothetical protein
MSAIGIDGSSNYSKAAIVNTQLEKSLHDIKLHFYGTA